MGGSWTNDESPPTIPRVHKDNENQHDIRTLLSFAAEEPNEKSR